MRTLILIGFFACIYLHFQNQEAEVATFDDSLSLKQSAVKNVNVQSPKVELPAITHISTEPSSSGFVPSEDEMMITDADVAEEYSEDDLSQLPWDDIEEGWKTHLKEYLTNVDPEKAEDMFAAYMEEKKKYVERVDFSESENGVSEEPTTSASDDPLVEQDKAGDVERLHTENLKEIFGDHYSQVESLHKEYVDSIQYLNRSSVKFSISL